MGLDLELFVPYGPNIEMFLALTEIYLDRQRELWDHLEEELEDKKTRIEKIRCRHYYDEEKDVDCYGEITEDALGQPLYYVKANDLANAFQTFPDELYSINIATKAFLEKLPPDYPIVLYWH